MGAVDPPDPRFPLANERTFLAWNRTVWAFIAGGLAVEQFVDVSRPLRLLVSIPLVLLGGFVGVGGYLRWRYAEDAIRSGDDVAPSRLPAVLAVAFALLTSGALVLVIV